MQTKIKLTPKAVFLVVFLCLFGMMNVSCDVPTPPYYGSTFSDVWEKVKSDPYIELPQTRVTAGSFLKAGTDILFEASLRTLNDRNDIRPHFNKLLHPNGVCLSGTWNITEDNPYTGYFSQDSSGLIIIRASVALSETERGHYRGFGFAGKIYPTTDPNHTELLKTANFFAIDNLSGTLADHYLDVALLNEPALVSPGASQTLGIAIIALISLGLSDANAGIRQLYEISELGLSNPDEAITPNWMKIEASTGQIRVDEDDFRNELDLINYTNEELFFDIYVTSQGSTASDKTWIYIGYILLNDYVVSDSCDHCLHFHHPKFKTIKTN